MIYFRKNENEIEKYEVLFDRDALLKLRARIIRNCAEVHKMHEELKLSQFRGGDRYIYLDGENWANHSMNVSIVHCEDIEKRKSGNKGVEYDHYDEYEVDLYYFDYTKYICPYIVSFIDELLLGKEEYIRVLFDRDFSSIKEFPTVEEKIKSLENELFTCQSYYVSNKRKKLNELNRRYKKFNEKHEPISKNYKQLQELIEKIEQEITNMDNEITKKIDELNRKLNEYHKIRDYNKHQKPSREYFDKLLSIVEFRLIDKLDISNIDRINEFFGSQIVDNEKKLVLN